MDPSWKYCPVCLAPLAGWLITINEDGSAHKFYTIHEGKSFIGSGVDCEVRIIDSDLSRQQAYITISDGVCTIVDMGNGKSMMVNNIVTPRTTLIDGDEILFGDALFKIKLI